MNAIFGNSMDMTQKSLDYLWAKQSVIANNISNNDTPGFKAKYLTFEDNLREKLLAARKLSKSSIAMRKGISASHMTLHTTNTESARLDGNNVQVEAEYIEQARSYLQYQYQLQSINSDIKQLRTAIKGQ